MGHSGQHILHVFKKTLVRPIHDSNASRCNIAIGGGDAVVKDVIPHKEGILVNPIPRGVEVACFHVAGSAEIRSSLSTVNTARTGI